MPLVPSGFGNTPAAFAGGAVTTLSGTGAPADGPAGTGAGSANSGALYIDLTNGDLYINREQELYLNPAASGVGDTYICLSTGQQVHAGATCAASTLKMKDSVVAYTNADAILKLRPVTFNFKAGYYDQRAEIGLIAEEAALVDPRFVFVASKLDTLSAVAPTIKLNALTQKLDTTAVVIKPGEPEALNISSIVAALVAQVQVQKRQLDSLSAVVFTLQPKAP